MGLDFNDLRTKGLTACAIVFTAAMGGAAICGLIVWGALTGDAGFSRQHALYMMCSFWLGCMAFTWWRIARTRDSWIGVESSTTLFHVFPFIVIGLGVLFQVYSFQSPSLDRRTLGWVMIIIELVVTLFYFSYIFLGITLRARVKRAVVVEFILLLAWTWWSFVHHP